MQDAAKRASWAGALFDTLGRVVAYYEQRLRTVAQELVSQEASQVQRVALQTRALAVQAGARTEGEAAAAKVRASSGSCCCQQSPPSPNCSQPEHISTSQTNWWVCCLQLASTSAELETAQAELARLQQQNSELKVSVLVNWFVSFSMRLKPLHAQAEQLTNRQAVDRAEQAAAEALQDCAKLQTVRCHCSPSGPAHLVPASRRSQAGPVETEVSSLLSQSWTERLLLASTTFQPNMWALLCSRAAVLQATAEVLGKDGRAQAGSLRAA